MEHETAENDSQPLQGCVLCSTAIDQDKRAEVIKYCEAMGGKHTLDLTSEVTHMIVGAIQTPKYEHIAMSRTDVHVLSLDWIYALRDAWTKAEDIDIAKLSLDYRLPTFFQLSICVTGFSDLSQRQSLVDAIKTHGGEYSGALSKSNSHLIVADVKSEKYVKACMWDIKTVTIEWLEQSIERGMVLKEKYFAPTLPPNQIGVGAFVPLQRKAKRPRTSAEPKDHAASHKRKMRRTASSKLNSQNETLWADINSLEVRDDLNVPNAWQDDNVELDRSRKSLPDQDIPVKPLLDRPAGLFSGWTCCIHGFSADRDTKIRNVLLENDARISNAVTDISSLTDTDDAACTVLIVPAAWNAKPGAKLPHVGPGIRHATEWWIERCIYKRHVFDPRNDVYSQSLVNLSSSCFAGQRISSTGLEHDLLYFAKLIKAAGGEYLEQFISTATLLVCDESRFSSEKIVYAMKHNIGIVTKNWFQESLRTGRRQPLHTFEMPRKTLTDLNETARTQLDGANDEALVERNNNEGQKERQRIMAQRLSSTRQKKTKSTLALSVPDQPAVQMPKAPAPPESPHVEVATVATLFVEEPLSQGDPSLELLPAEVDTDLLGRPSDIRDVSPAVDLTSLDDVANKENQPAMDDGKAQAEPTGKSERRELNDAVSELLSLRQSRGAAMVNDATSRPRRKRDQKLGRAPSGANSASLLNQPRLESADSDNTASPLDDTATLAPLPSQQLLYEDPGAEELRRRMNKRLGSEFVDDEGIGTRVERLGVIKDADANVDTGVGQRVRGRRG